MGKEENDKVRVTWSSKREGGAAVTNLFIWFLTSETVSELGLSDRSRFLTSETASELGKPVRSMCQFVDPRLLTMSGLRNSGSLSETSSLTPHFLLHVTSREDRSTRGTVPDIGDRFRARIARPTPASPIEDRGTAIPIEDRDRTIPERLRLCGVIVKGLPVSLMWRKNGNPGSLSETSSPTPHILLQVTSREDRSTRGTVGAGVD
ncbi:hypothetical protein F2Q69_00028329 [Brassica cretica]|uniref:Uncharacterized protein n=1 Tax=Brassica cretica TaxID=69181 RepID=A0A8S9S4M1_BRACR|nr:hypothetical protein F2Q69_00028329 [Brassica cretica]